MAPKRKKSRKSEIEQALLAPAPVILPEEDDENDPLYADKKEMRQQIALSEVRHGLLKTPKGLEGDAAGKHADTRLEALLPYAVAELEDQLLHAPDRKTRMEAARQVLDSTGRGKAERGVNTAPSIVINMGPGGSMTPWRSASTRTVDGEVKRESNSDGGTLATSAGPAGQVQST